MTAQVRTYQVTSRKGDIIDVQGTSMTVVRGALVVSNMQNKVFMMPMELLAHAGRLIEQPKPDVIIEVPPATATASEPALTLPADLKAPLTVEDLNELDNGAFIYDKDGDASVKLEDGTWTLKSVGGSPLAHRTQDGTPSEFLLDSYYGRNYGPFTRA